MNQPFNPGRPLVLEWRRGPFAGRALTLHCGKTLIRWPQESGEPFPQLLFIQGPGGAVVRAVGDDVVVNGVRSDVHWLQPGDTLSHPRFTARVACGPNAIPADSNGTSAETKLPERPSNSAPAQRGQRRIWRKWHQAFRRMESQWEQMDHLVNESVLARVDELSKKLDTLIDQWNAPAGATPPPESRETTTTPASPTAANEQPGAMPAEEPCPVTTDSSTVLCFRDDEANERSTAGRNLADATLSARLFRKSSDTDLSALRNDLTAWKNSLLSTTAAKEVAPEEPPSELHAEEPSHAPSPTVPVRPPSEDLFDRAAATLNAIGKTPARIQDVVANDDAQGAADDTDVDTVPPMGSPEPDLPNREEPVGGPESANDDVSSYMARFFSRLNIPVPADTPGDPLEETPAPVTRELPPATNRVRQSGDRLTYVAPVTRELPPATNEVNPHDDLLDVDPSANEPVEDYLPHAKAPERNINLATLRQLANQSTRSAIQSFTQKKRKQRFRLHGLMWVIGGFAVSAGLLVMSKQPGDWWFLAGVCMIISTTMVSVWLFLKDRMGELILNPQASDEPRPADAVAESTSDPESP